MKPFVLWTCPKCEAHIRVRGASEVIHECWKANYRVVRFVPVSISSCEAISK